MVAILFYQHINDTACHQLIKFVGEVALVPIGFVQGYDQMSSRFQDAQKFIAGIGIDVTK